MSERTHLSIGEVLSLLQEEFPDVTISKIRFLESQGLLDPERTPSGYRKFYDADIERLRWILRQQRENFLPLKVIKDRLESGELDELLAPTNASNAVADRSTSAADSDAKGEQTAADHGTESAPALAHEAVGTTTDGAPGAPGEPSPDAESGQRRRRQSLLDSGDTTVSMTVDELAKAAGLTARQLGELERYGLVAGEKMGNATVYDDDALLAARTCAAFIRHGVEARHLRMYKRAAESEAAFFEQLLLPLLRKRDKETRQRAMATLDELVALGDSLRMVLLRNTLREYLDPS
ncbi:MAG: MerR family DNA-binding transcriptional regulator [Acidimicrobiales bacterium]|nr:MerR family DNA-binding transcriptional regulator [Acidimicrobiales bacterium]